jgi:hypothetical protein
MQHLAEKLLGLRGTASSSKSRLLEGWDAQVQGVRGKIRGLERAVQEGIQTKINKYATQVRARVLRA